MKVWDRASSRGAQVLAVAGTGGPAAGAAEGHALRSAFTGDGSDAVHTAGQPAVVEFQVTGEVGAGSAVGVVPLGGQGG